MIDRWTPNLSNLRDYLADKLPSTEEALRYAQTAGLRVAMLKHAPRPIDMWHEVIDASMPKRFGTMEALFQALLKDFAQDQTILAAQRGHLTDIPSVGPRMIDTRWHGDSMEVQEKITGQQSTLLPINFLEQGLEAARSVAKLLVQQPDGTTASGTGFLLAGGLLVTNHHVLPDANSAVGCRCLFNYRHLPTGLLSEGTSEIVEAGAEYFTSQVDDISVVRLGEDANQRWGQLTLAADRPPARLSPANVIQHPGGRPKEIALYHNFVVFSDANRVQYLTDTEPGSSGSPVFDNEWKVIAIHHSGGWIPEPGTRSRCFRNEGIAALRMKQLLDGWGL